MSACLFSKDVVSNLMKGKESNAFASFEELTHPLSRVTLREPRRRPL